MPSVVIPAHNESKVIHRCLTALLHDEMPADLQVVVVCNGCDDDTAAIAGSFEGVRVVETDTPSKTDAINLGENAVDGYPRLYLDADVELSQGGFGLLMDSLQGDVHAVAPTPRFEDSGSSLLVRMFYAAWTRMPFYNDSMIGGSGAYALSAEGRARFDVFPDLISDDGFVRLQFPAHQRQRVRSVTSTVHCPSRMSDLIAMMTRVRAGGIELRTRYPGLHAREETTRRDGIRTMLSNPALWPCFLVYGITRLITRRRAGRMLESLKTTGTTWPRDDSSRVRGA